MGGSPCRPRVPQDMKVLLLTHHFPPDPSVGAIRPRNLARGFAREGHEVVVMTGAVEGAPLADVVDGVAIHRVELRPSLRERLVAVRRQVLGTRRQPAAGAVGATDPAGQTVNEASRLRRWVNSLLWLPDDRQGAAMAFVRQARKLVLPRAESVVSSGPPHSIHLAGTVLAKGWGVPHVMEYRDPWSDNTFKPAFVRSAVSDWLDSRLEAMCLRRAALVVTVTESFGELLRQRGVDGRKLLLARNGLPDQPLGDLHVGRTDEFLIVHIGSLYHRRDPRPFLVGLALAMAQLRTSGPSVRVVFAGEHSTRFEGLDLRLEVGRLGLANNVEFLDLLPHAEALALIRRADLVLLFAQHQPLQVPNKLYEYLWAGTSVLAFADETGKSARILRAADPQSAVTSEDPDAVAEVLCDAVRGGKHRSARSRNLSYLESLTVSNQLRGVVAASELLVSRWPGLAAA